MQSPTISLIMDSPAKLSQTLIRHFTIIHIDQMIVMCHCYILTELTTFHPCNGFMFPGKFEKEKECFIITSQTSLSIRGEELSLEKLRTLQIQKIFSTLL